MSELTLVTRLRDAAQAQGFDRQAEDEVFELIAQDSCAKCCQDSGGGNNLPSDDSDGK